MKIVIDKAALDYIKEKGGVIYVNLFTTTKCCMSVTEPKVNLGEPESKRGFDEYTIEDIKVYVSNSIRLEDDELKMILSNILGIKNFYVSGVKIF